MSADNEDIKAIRSITNKVLYTPDYTAQNLIDDLDTISDRTTADSSFGIIVRSLIFEVTRNKKV